MKECFLEQTADVQYGCMRGRCLSVRLSVCQSLTQQIYVRYRGLKSGGDP